MGMSSRLLALAVLLLAVALAAAPARAVELGVSDSDASTFSDQWWAGLNVHRARIVVPYDVATTTGAAGVQRRADFERYLSGAAAAGVDVLVVFGPSVDVRAPDTGDPVAPTADEFAAAFQAFRARYPDVTTIAPWNEPNNRDATGYPLGSQPQLAADYWLRAKQTCPSACTLVAGDFAGAVGDPYVGAYQAELAANGAVPDVWAFHAYGDVNRYQVIGASDAPITRWFLAQLQGPWAGARIWIDEVGARYRDASGLIWGDASQRDATSLLLGLATLDPRIEAVYYYNFANGCAAPQDCAVQDRGLVSPAPLNGQPPDYDAADRRRAAYDVIAARGPVIAPVAALPPAVTIDAPAQGAALRSATPTFTGRAAQTVDSAPTVTLQLFRGAGESESGAPAQTLSAPVVAGRWSVAAAALADGVYTARARQAGDPGTTGISEDLVFTVDTIAPTTAIASGPAPLSGARSPSVAFAASEPDVTYRCSLDGRRPAACASPLALRRLALGAHSFAVRATDAAGNVQARPTRIRWRVVSLASALAPRLAGIAQLLGGGLPLAAACEDRCRVAAQLELPGPGGGVLAHAAVRRSRAGAFALRLRPAGGAGGLLAGRSSAVARLTLVLEARGSRRATVTRTVALVRAGALAALARHGLPVTLACSTACGARGELWIGAGLARRLRLRATAVRGGRDGLPRSARWVALAARHAVRGGAGGGDLVLRLGRGAPRARLPRLASASLRIVALAAAPDADRRPLAWTLALPR